jgi:hypothetical protein
MRNDISSGFSESLERGKPCIRKLELVATHVGRGGVPATVRLSRTVYMLFKESSQLTLIDSRPYSHRSRILLVNATKVSLENLQKPVL